MRQCAVPPEAQDKESSEAVEKVLVTRCCWTDFATGHQELPAVYRGEDV